MAVMVTMTLKADAVTYQGMHGQLLPAAKGAGLLFHSGREVDGGIGIVDFWPSAAAFESFRDGPMAQGAQAAGMEMPDDIEIVPVLTADS
jgi:hypothetical protein